MEVPRPEYDTKKVAKVNIPRRPGSGPVEETKKASEDRIVMLSDGIFAIAITLLVLSIQIPPHINDKHEFLAALRGDFYNNTQSYVITFAVLAAYWTNHRRLMSVVTGVDKPFLWLNILFLAFVAYFPAASSLLSGSKFPEAVIIYTVVLVGCGYSAVLLWMYALAKHRLIPSNSGIGSSTRRILGAATTPTFFLASLLLLLLPPFSSDPGMLFYSWLLLPLLNLVYMLVVRFSKKRKQAV